MVDSAKYIAPERLRDVFVQSRYASTTSYWLSVRLVNANGRVMDLTYGYYEPNAFCLPWAITIDGVTVSCLSLSITDFVRQVCPSMIPTDNKVPALYEIVKAMY